MIVNPLTKRKVKIGGKTHLLLMLHGKLPMIPKYREEVNCLKIKEQFRKDCPKGRLRLSKNPPVLKISKKYVTPKPSKPKVIPVMKLRLPPLIEGKRYSRKELNKLLKPLGYSRKQVNEAVKLHSKQLKEYKAKKAEEASKARDARHAKK